MVDLQKTGKLKLHEFKELVSDERANKYFNSLMRKIRRNNEDLEKKEHRQFPFAIDMMLEYIVKRE